MLNHKPKYPKHRSRSKYLILSANHSNSVGGNGRPAPSLIKCLIQSQPLYKSKINFSYLLSSFNQDLLQIFFFICCMIAQTFTALRKAVNMGQERKFSAI